MNVSKSLGTLCLAATVGMGVAQERNDSDEASRAMAEMMEKMARYTQPGAHHELLERFLGTWKTETRFFMGQTPSAAELGEAVTRSQLLGHEALRWARAGKSPLRCSSKRTKSLSIDGFFITSWAEKVGIGSMPKNFMLRCMGQRRSSTERPSKKGASGFSNESAGALNVSENM